MTHDKPLCPDAWAIPPTPIMLKHGNNYHACSKCGEPVETLNLKDTAMAYASVDELVYSLLIVHQFGCIALERSDGGLRDYTCTCGNDRKTKAAIQAYTAAKVREALLPLKRYEMSLDAMLEIDRLIAELSTNTEDN